VIRRTWFGILLVALVVAWFAPTLVLHVTRTFDAFTFNDDARILIWPFFRDAEPTLFVGDPFVTYFQAGLPEGYLALYHTLGRLGLARVASEVLPYLLLFVTLGFLTASGYRLGGKSGALLTAVLLLGSVSVMDRLGGGLPRAFAFPLVACASYALVQGRAGMLAVLTVLGAAFYPVVAALLGLSLFFLLVLPSRLRGNTETTELKKRIGLVLVTFFCISGLLLPTMLRLRTYGETITPKTLSSYPEAGPGGRLGPEQQAPFPPWYRSAGFHAKQALLGQGPLLGGSVAASFRRSDTKANALVGAVLVGACASFGLRTRRKRSVAPEVIRLGTLLLAMIVGYVLASLVTPALFLPERYAQYAAPLLSILLVATGFGVPNDSETNLRPEPRTSKAVPPRTSNVRWSTLGSWALTLVVLLLLAGKGTSWTGIEVWIPPAERSLYAELSKLPKDSLIAGWPSGPLENVPYLSKRRVLTNYQLEMPFHRTFTEGTRQRLRALFEAYFATDNSAITALNRRFGVTHLLVDPEIFGDNTPSYYRPFDTLVWQLYGAARARPRLLELARDPAVGRRIGRLYLVELKPLALAVQDKP
jgi:hypothetical protein